MDTLVGSTLRQGVRARKSAGSYRREDELGCTEMPEKRGNSCGTWFMPRVYPSLPSASSWHTNLLLSYSNKFSRISFVGSFKLCSSFVQSSKAVIAKDNSPLIMLIDFYRAVQMQPKKKSSVKLSSRRCVTLMLLITRINHPLSREIWKLLLSICLDHKTWLLQCHEELWDGTRACC